MPELGPMGRGGARRRTRRRVNARNESDNEQSEVQKQSIGGTDKLDKLAKILKDKGVISDEEYNLLLS